MIRWFREVIRLLREILHELRKFNHPRPTSVQIRFSGAHMADKTIKVGESTVATVVVLDQFGKEFPFDFGANPPQWNVDQTSNVGLAPGDQPNQELATGLAVTTSDATLTVIVPGVAQPTGTATIAVEQEAPVATSVAIHFA